MFPLISVFCNCPVIIEDLWLSPVARWFYCGGKFRKLERKCGIYLYIIKMQWAGCAGRSCCSHRQMERGEECCCLLWLPWWGRRWSVCGETTIVSKVKADWITIQQVALTLCPHHQVTNCAGLTTHTGGAIISYQPPSCTQQGTDLILLIDLSGQWSCGTSQSVWSLLE